MASFHPMHSSLESLATTWPRTTTERMMATSVFQQRMTHRQVKRRLTLRSGSSNASGCQAQQLHHLSRQFLRCNFFNFWSGWPQNTPRSKVSRSGIPILYIEKIDMLIHKPSAHGRFFVFKFWAPLHHDQHFKINAGWLLSHAPERKLVIACPCSVGRNKHIQKHTKTIILKLTTIYSTC